MRALLTCGLVLVTGCAPSPSDLQATLDGLDGAHVRGVARLGDEYVITGTCRGSDDGFEAHIQAVSSSLEELATSAKSAVHSSCTRKEIERLDVELRDMLGNAVDPPECAQLAERYEQIRRDSVLERNNKKRSLALSAEAKKVRGQQESLRCSIR